jgi:mannose-6-phosphate isomerase-like protein (cupin superfamily)
LDTNGEPPVSSEDAKREKPWGYERPIGEFRGIFLKELFIRKGSKSSLHYHAHKDEFFYLVKGKITVLVEDKEILMTPGDSLRITPGQQHRIIPQEDSLILELGTRMFGDVTRVADDYQRPKSE